MSSDPTPFGPTWYAATMVAAPERAPLVHDLDVDACVIGGGLAGLTAARELARRGWSVAVLEAQRVAWNASGRNAGFVTPGFAERLEAIVERVGLKRAKELWALSVAGVEYVRAAIGETGMPGVEPVDGRLTVRRTDGDDALLRHVAMLRVDFACDAEAWPTEQVREVLRSPVYFQAVHLPAAFHVHALNYALGLAAAAEGAGARIFEGTRALAIDAAGVRKRVETANGRVRAAHIVLAGGPHLGSVFPLVSETSLPVTSYIATTAPLGEQLLEAIRYSGAVADTRRAGDYYRIIGGDRLMWGGRISTRISTPRRLKRLMRRDIHKVYPQLGEVEIEHAWAGVMSYAVHKMPQIGELSPGLWLAGAFGGHGLNTTAMAGELIARAISEGDDRWRLFSDYELVWAGGRFGRVAAQAISWSMRARDAVEERVARYREAARRRAAAKAVRLAAEAARREAEGAARRATEEAARRAAEEIAERIGQEQRQAAAAAAHRAAEEQDLRAETEAALWAGAEAARLAGEEETLRRGLEETERRAAAAAAHRAFEEAARAAAQALAQQIARTRQRGAEAGDAIDPEPLPPKASADAALHVDAPDAPLAVSTPEPPLERKPPRKGRRPKRDQP